MIRFKVILPTVLVVAGIMSCQLAVVQNASPAQLKMLQQLPPDQQQEVIEAMLGGADSSSDQPIDFPELVIESCAYCVGRRSKHDANL
jgi:hypothetical protein